MPSAWVCCGVFLPCGLLYSVVAAAVLLADPLATTAMIVAFGAGTVPLLLGSGLLMLRFRSAINRRGLRWLAAGLLGLTGLLIGLGPWLAHLVDQPWIQFLVDCVTWRPASGIEVLPPLRLVL